VSDSPAHNNSELITLHPQITDNHRLPSIQYLIQ